MAISTNQKPAIYRNLYENTGPDRLVPLWWKGFYDSPRMASRNMRNVHMNWLQTGLMSKDVGPTLNQRVAFRVSLLAVRSTEAAYGLH